MPHFTLHSPVRDVLGAQTNQGEDYDTWITSPSQHLGNVRQQINILYSELIQAGRMSKRKHMSEFLVVSVYRGWSVQGRSSDRVMGS